MINFQKFLSRWSKSRVRRKFSTSLCNRFVASRSWSRDFFHVRLRRRWKNDFTRISWIVDQAARRMTKTKRRWRTKSQASIGCPIMPAGLRSVARASVARYSVDPPISSLWKCSTSLFFSGMGPDVRWCDATTRSRSAATHLAKTRKSEWLESFASVNDARDFSFFDTVSCA